MHQMPQSWLCQLYILQEKACSQIPKGESSTKLSLSFSNPPSYLLCHLLLFLTSFYIFITLATQAYPHQHYHVLLTVNYTERERENCNETNRVKPKLDNGSTVELIDSPGPGKAFGPIP
jgi:hypothetical protein